MNKLIVLGILFLFVAGSVVPISGFNLEQPNIASTSGDILYVGGSGEGNYTKIQDAIDNASDGDTVFVYNGEYNENLIVYNSIKVIGENKYTTVIKYDINKPLVEISADGVTFSGFTIKNTDHSYYSSGITVESNNNLISENIFPGVSYAIKINQGSNNVVSNNILSYNTTATVGISITNSSKNTVIGNNITGYFAGIKATDCSAGSPNKIIGNTIDGFESRYGIFIYIRNKKFEIAGNTISNVQDDKGAAIKIETGFHNVHHNEISSNNLGINIENGNKRFVGGFFHHNNFLSNEYDVEFSIRFADIFLTRWYSNYWNKPRNVPKQLMGEAHFSIAIIYFFFEIPWIEFDWRPAKAPNDI